MSLESLPPCTWLYAKDRRSWLEGMIQSLTEELATMAPHKWNAQKRADREKAIAMYSGSLSRLDAAEAEGRRP
jgi:hypothetical protein